MKPIKEGVMYRLTLLACLSLALIAAAQQPVSSPSAYSSSMPSGVTQELMKAPEPGHPLDPHDVDVLTGKDKEQQTGAYANGSAYLMYGPGTAYGYGAGSGYRRGSSVPPLAGDIFPQSRDLTVPRVPFFGFGPHRRIGQFATPFAPGSLAGSILRFPLFGVHRPGFGFHF